MGKLKKIFTNKRILILIAALLISAYLIYPVFNEGVAIRGVAKGSAAAQAYPEPILSPPQTIKPTQREVIKQIDGKTIKTPAEYYEATKNLQINQTLTIKTSKNTYFVTTKPKKIITVLNETETTKITKAIFNTTTNTTENITVTETKNKTKEEIIGVEDLGLVVYPRPSNNIKRGLDLEGGTRVLLQPETEIKTEDLDIIITNIKQRLDVYGVSDVTVRTTKDFFGNTYISVEIAGVNEEEIKSLLTNQGKFEAKIGEETIFRGGNKDILSVCRTAQCSQVDNAGCQQTTTGETFCGFRFSITLSQKAAEAQAAATANLQVIDVGFGRGTEGYLSKNLSLYLDNELVDELRIGSSLKGNAATDIQISGSGIGTTKEAARQDALQGMKKLQTVLITGSLPVKLKVVKTDTISPTVGSEFVKNALYVGLLSLIAIVLIIAIRYRTPKVSIPIIVTIFSEIIIVLGFASVIGWRMDIVAIGAIIIAIGSGVDDQIVITDEALGRDRKRKESINWKEKFKKSFFIVLTSYFTLVVAMVPLMFAGAGLLLGFAITTIAGVTAGILITRPAFAALLEILIEK